MNKTCRVCYTDVPETDLAILTDRNGHAWRICSECVKALWQERRPPVAPESVGDLAILTALAQLVGVVTSLADHLANDGDKNYIVTHLNGACAEARKVYQS